MQWHGMGSLSGDTTLQAAPSVPRAVTERPRTTLPNKTLPSSSAYPIGGKINCPLRALGKEHV